MRVVRTGQWAGWLGAAAIAAAGGGGFLALRSTGFVPSVPSIGLASAQRQPLTGEPGRLVDRIRRLSSEDDQRRMSIERERLGEIVRDSGATARDLLQLFEEAAFDDPDVDLAVLETLLSSSDKGIAERAQDAARRREADYFRPRSASEILERLLIETDPVFIASLPPEALDDPSVFLEIQDRAVLDLDPAVRAAAITALGRSASAKVMQFFQYRLQSETNAEVRQAIAMSLMLRGESEAGIALAALLANPYEPASVRRCAASALATHPMLPAATKALLEALAIDADHTVRSSAAQSLGHVPADRDVVSALVQSLKTDSSLEVRSAAALSLAQSQDAEARSALEEAIVWDGSDDVRKNAATALWMIDQIAAAVESRDSVQPAGAEQLIGPR